jgi:hypothetical protein
LELGPDRCVISIKVSEYEDMDCGGGRAPLRYYDGCT